ncbi:MAG TPA: hypothetical protein VGT08_21135 [Terracidiphilus sp.]|nr:hypothetical protein [Terracidiphilus sp.]
MYLEAYYASYLGLCAALIFWLGWTLHRAGSVFLSDAFGDNATLVRAVAHLLDVGFYLVSIGYIGVSYQTFWQQINSYEMVAQTVSAKVGGFLLLLGFAHLFNLLLLALFRRRGNPVNGAAAS